MSDPDLEQMILRYVSRSTYRPVKPKALAKRLGLSFSEHGAVRTSVGNLVRQGKVVFGADHLVRPVSRPHRGHVCGRFRRAEGGFGFVRPLDAGPSPDRRDDIYVPARYTSTAADGDVVRVRVSSRKRRGEIRRVGEVVEIVERRTHQFVGTYFEAQGQGFVRVDGATFSHPLAVGDPGAKNVQRDDKVVVEMVRFPTARRAGEAVITEVLGDRRRPGVDTRLIMRQLGLPNAFPKEVLAEARAAAEAFDERNIGDRIDLTAETVITIDPEGARDFDDAISLTWLPKRHWRLGVHIADVAHFVSPGSAIDEEARERGTSIYLPDRVIPMLPEILSNNLASLQPGRLRYTKSVFIEFTPEGVWVDTQLRSSVIKSARRFTYEEVDHFLANPPWWKRELQPDVFRLLTDMHRQAMLLRKRRMDHGAIELTMPEVKIELDGKGNVRSARQVERTASHQIIEEFMLAANLAVADQLRRRRIPFLRRIHEAPDSRKLKDLTEFVRLLGLKVASLESRFEIQRVLDMVRGRPQQYAVNFAVLRAMKKAVYGPEDSGHHALAADCYCHFTSPIRRYPDLTIHRLLEHPTRRKARPPDVDHLVLLGAHCSEREQRAELAERELTRLKLLRYLEPRIGQVMEAVVTGVESFGAFAQLSEIPVEGLILIDSLDQDDYYFDAESCALCGRRRGNVIRLGDVLQVEVAHVDLDRRELDLHYAGRADRTGTMSGARPAKPSVRSKKAPTSATKKRKPVRRKTRR